MGILPLFSPTNAGRIVKLVELILQISPCPQIKTEAREGPQQGLKHGQLQEAYVVIESLFTWQASQEELKLLWLIAAEQGAAQLRRAMTLRMVMA
jgi:hypothetical protein